MTKALALLQFLEDVNSDEEINLSPLATALVNIIDSVDPNDTVDNYISNKLSKYDPNGDMTTDEVVAMMSDEEVNSIYTELKSLVDSEGVTYSEESSLIEGKETDPETDPDDDDDDDDIDTRSAEDNYEKGKKKDDDDKKSAEECKDSKKSRKK